MHVNTHGCTHYTHAHAREKWKGDYSCKHLHSDPMIGFLGGTSNLGLDKLYQRTESSLQSSPSCLKTLLKHSNADSFIYGPLGEPADPTSSWWRCSWMQPSHITLPCQHQQLEGSSRQGNTMNTKGFCLWDCRCGSYSTESIYRHQTPLCHQDTKNSFSIKISSWVTEMSFSNQKWWKDKEE